MTSLLSKISTLIALGITISFDKGESYNSFKIELSKGKNKKLVVLPFDHLNEGRIVDYIEIMEKEILKEEVDERE